MKTKASSPSIAIPFLALWPTHLHQRSRLPMRKIALKNRSREESRWIFSWSDEKRARRDMFLWWRHISGQAISRRGGRGSADFNDQSHDDVVAAAHKNVSLGCRNISVETYRRENAGRILDPRAGDMLSDLIFPQRTLLCFYRFRSLSKHEADRPPNNRSAKKNRSTKHALLPIIVLIISVTQSTPRHAPASWLPFSILSRLGLLSA